MKTKRLDYKGMEVKMLTSKGNKNKNKNKDHGISYKDVLLRYTIVAVMLIGLSFLITTPALHEGYSFQRVAIRNSLQIIAMLNLLMGCLHIVKHLATLEKHKNAEDMKRQFGNRTSAELDIPGVDTDLSITPPKFLLLYFVVLYILVVLISLRVELEYALGANLINMTPIIEKAQMSLSVREYLFKVMVIILTLFFIPWLISTDPCSSVDFDWETLSYGFIGVAIIMLATTFSIFLSDIKPLVSPEQIRQVALLDYLAKMIAVVAVVASIKAVIKSGEEASDNQIRLWGKEYQHRNNQQQKYKSNTNIVKKSNE